MHRIFELIGVYFIVNLFGLDSDLDKFVFWTPECLWNKDTVYHTWSSGSTYLRVQRKSFFTACHSGKLKLTFTSPNIISTIPHNVLMSRLISQFFCNLNSSTNVTCPSGKLRTEFTNLIAKSTSPGLWDTTFFACCYLHNISGVCCSLCSTLTA